MNWLCFASLVTIVVVPCAYAQQDCPWAGQWVDVPSSDPHVERLYRRRELPCYEEEIEDRDVVCPPWSEWNEWVDIPGDPNQVQTRSRSRGPPCTGTQTEHFQPACPQNILITVDTSSSVSRRRFTQLKEGLILMLKNADIRVPFTHVGCCYFGTTTEVIIPLTPFHNHAEVNRLIDRSTSLSGRTKVSLGLECLYNEWLSSTRLGIQTICVLIIDDNPSNPPNDGEELANTRRWVNILQNSTCDEFVIFAIGNAFHNIAEIESWRDPLTSNNYFHTSSFAQFRAFFERENAFPTFCPFDGQWSAYGDWSDCSATCGGGRKFRVRTCTYPMPTEGGSDCDSADGDSLDEECNPTPCPLDGQWSAYGDWSDCSATCGGGRKFRVRTCTNPMPTEGGSDCDSADGDSLDEECNPTPCPHDGEWSSWDPWGACSVTCGGGTRRRTRECDNPPPIFGGDECPGSYANSESCNVQPCPVAGGWASWSTWSDCSVTCGGGGVRRRSRSCTNPLPQNGGENCQGQADEEDIGCSGPCIINGSWGRWTPWSDCSATCGRGTSKRIRRCTNPPPPIGGPECPGPSNERKNCSEGTCPEPGGCVVSTWSLWVPMFLCPGLVGLSSGRYQSTDWCVTTRSRRVIQQPIAPGTCPSLYDDAVSVNPRCYPDSARNIPEETGCFSLNMNFDHQFPCSSQLSITCLMAKCIHASVNPVCWDTVCQLETTILSCIKKHSDCSEQQAVSLLPAEYQCLFQTKCQNRTSLQYPLLTDESYNYGAILGVDLDDCWGLLRAGRSKAEKKSLAPTVYICSRNKLREATLSSSNMRLALDRVQVELSCRMNLTDISRLRELDARSSSVMDFRTNRTTVGVYGDPHLRTYQRAQLTTCASEGEQVYLRSRILDIRGVNSKLCPESLATFLSQVTFNFKSLLNPDVVTARYGAGNGQHPAQIEQLISDVIAADIVRLEFVNWRRIRMIWNHTGMVIDFSSWGSSYFFTLRVAESVLQGGEGLLVEGCPGDMILDRGVILNNEDRRCDVISEAVQLIPPTSFESSQASIGIMGTTTPQPTSRPNTSAIDTTTQHANLITVAEARSACENRSHVTDGDVTLLMGDNLEMCMFDVLVTGDPEYVVMAVEAVNSQIEAIEMDPVIRAEASIWTFIEAELPTTDTLTTITGSAYTPVGTSPLPDGCTLDDAKLVGLLVLVLILLVLLVIIVVIMIILWRRIRSKKHDGVEEGKYGSLKKLEKPKTDSPLEMASFNGSSGVVEKDGEADLDMPDKPTYLTVTNDAENDAYAQPSKPIDDDVDVYVNVAENDG